MTLLGHVTENFTENAVSPLLLRASPTRVDTERLAERETLLHRLGSKLNRTVLNSCGNSLSVAQKHVTFAQPGFFANRVIFTEFTIFGNTKQVIQDHDTVFDNSILFHKNDPLRIQNTGRAGPALCALAPRQLVSRPVPPPRSPGRPQTSIT